MYLSKIIKTDEHTYVYDALNNKFALLQSEDDIYNESKYADFLSENDFRDIKEPCEFEIKYPYSEEELEKMYNTSIKSMTLALTEQCNLRCKYCGYMPKYMDESYTLKEMSSDTAFKAIDILMKNSHESEICHVGFYGGEPLLRLNLIKECVAYIKEKDNFYSVGGDSLLIAQVVTKMRKSIKQLENISWDKLMREVLENPTLEGMSNIISQKEHSIQKMQKTSMSKYIHKYNETENAPVKVISFFHAGTGRLIDYKHMVENLLDKDMSDTQLIGFTYGEYQQYMETPVESLVQDRANLYAETLLEFNVDRYTLVGYCVGGFLALETAKILLENGKKVKLIMIDSRLCQHTISNQLLMEYAYGLSMELDMDNTPYSIKPVMLKEALEKILNGENRNIKNSELTKLSDEYAELGEVFTNLLDMTHEERIKALFNSKKQHNFNGEESTISMLNLLYDIYEHTFNAMMRYRPEGIYSGDITYINATEGIVNFYPDTNVATTWEDMVLGEFKIVNIYANHASIVGAEHSKEILPYIE